MPRLIRLLIPFLLLCATAPTSAQALAEIDLGGIVIAPTVIGNGTLEFAVTTRNGRLLLEPVFRVEGTTVLVIVSAVDVPLLAPDSTYSVSVGPLPPGDYTISYHNVTAPFDYVPTPANRIATQTFQMLAASEPATVPSGSAPFLLVMIAAFVALGLHADRIARA